MLFGRDHLDGREHSGAEAALGVREGRANAHVAGGDVDLGVDGLNSPSQVAPGKDRRAGALADLQLGQSLLR